MLRLAGDSDNGSGQNWIHVQDTVADFSLTSPPQTLLARYPNERYSFNLEWDDILGHHHTGWGSNDAYENAGIYSGTTSTPRYTLKYQMAPGWGVGVVNWNLVDAQGDDWSDIATVEGGYGILRVHPSPISGVAAYAWTSTDDRIYAPFEYAFTIRMASPVPSHSPYQYGFYVGCLSLVNLWPGDDVVGGAGGTVTLPLDWTQDVGVHVKVDSTGTYIRVWQASDPEPSAWTLSNTSAGWQWTDAVDYIWPSFTLQPADDDLTSENALYVGSPTPPGGGTAISSPDWDVTATGWGS